VIFLFTRIVVVGCCCDDETQFAGKSVQQQKTSSWPKLRPRANKTSAGSRKFIFGQKRKLRRATRKLRRATRKHTKLEVFV
jgi:hypothetical protein